jgi:hypothetical protein
VRRNVEKIFDYRHERIEQMFGEKNSATDERR